MKRTKFIVALCASAVLACGALTGCGKKSGADEYDEKGRLILDMKNVYWEGYDGSDRYTEFINEKFGVHVKGSNYDYAGWDGAVNNAINGNNITDTFHYNLKAYNFGSTYERWVEGKVIKQIPDDLSRWPNLKAMLDKISNLDALKSVDGHLYGIPIINDLVNYTKNFSNFTYIYRRDWVKALDAEMKASDPTWNPIYRENDEYTWAEFNRMCQVLKGSWEASTKNSIMVDESDYYPSVALFYRNSPHCYTTDAQGKAINAYTAPETMQGLDVAYDFTTTKKYYSQDQFKFDANKAKEAYKSDTAAILYENFNLENYGGLRDEMRSSHQDNLDDATAFLKIKGENGKYALEGTENWFSMTFFNYDISDMKMEKILDIMDYLLTEEGTRLAIYGVEGYDYNIVDGQVVLTKKGWEKDAYGNYVPKMMGAKMLRKMVCLGNETKSYDPYTKKDSFDLMNAWQNEMVKAQADGDLRIVKEPSKLSWMSTPTKNSKTQGLLETANSKELSYAFGQISRQQYLDYFSENNTWKTVLQEMNAKL